MNSSGEAGGDQAQLTLYHSATSVCSAKVRLVLVELGLTWRDQLLDLAKGEQFSEEYLALNPNCVVPTLIDGGQVVVESNDIMLHLCRRFGSGKPELAQAGCSIWLHRSLSLHAAINTLTQLIVNRDRLLALQPDDLERRYANIPDADRAAKLRDIVENGVESSNVSRAVATIRSTIIEADAAAGTSAWLAGEAYSLADAAVLPFFYRLELLGLSSIWHGRQSFEHWLANAKGRACFDGAIEAYLSEKAVEKFAIAADNARPQIAKILDT